jgi:hypothetical protein
MKLFLPPKKTMIELGVLFPLLGVFYIFYPQKEGIALFISGYIWNWAATQEMGPMYENRQYRYSMLSTIRNIQHVILKPFRAFPVIFQRLMSVFPAGIFWAMIIHMNQSEMPWWATFLGSLAFEVLQIEFKFIQSHKGKDLL